MRNVEARAAQVLYGNEDGDLICSGNVLRLLEVGWRQKGRAWSGAGRRR